MQEKNLTELEIRKYFLKYYQKVMNLAIKHPEYKVGQNNHHLLSENGKQASRILHYTNKIYGLITDLERTHTFIKRFPLKKYYEENNIDQLDFIKYHYEVFIHKIHTLLEVKKLWLNEFYEIGLREKDCNWNNLKSYKKIQKSPTKDIIECYYKSFKHIIEYRHLNTHRAFFKDTKSEDLKRDLTIYNGYKKFGIDNDKDLIKIKPKFLIEYQIRKYRKEKIIHIKEGIEIANIYSEKFITIIQTELLRKILKKTA